MLIIFSSCQPLSPAQDAATGDTPQPTRLPALSDAAITPENAGQLTAVARWGEGKAFDVVADPAGRYLGVVTTVGLAVYDAATWQPVDFIEPTEPIRSAAFSPDGRFLAIAGWQNNQISLWEVGSDQPPTALSGGESILQITFTADGQLISSAAHQVASHAWQSAAAPVNLIAAPANGRLGRMAWTPNGEFIAVPLQTQTGSEVAVRPTAAGGESPSVLRSETGMTLENGRLSADGAYYAAITTDRTMQRDNTLSIWQTAVPDVLYQRPVGRFVAEDNWAMGSDGRFLAVTTPTGEIDIVQLDGGQTIATIPAAANLDDASHLKLLLAGANLVVAWPDGRLALWDVTQNEPTQASAGNGVPLIALRLLPDNAHFAAVDQNGLVEIRQLPDGRLLQSLAAHTLDDITDVTFAPDGATTAVSFASGLVQIWGLHGTPQQTLGQPSGKVDSVAFSPDGRFLAAGAGQRTGPIAFDDTVNVWQVADGALHVAVGGEKEDVPGCSFFRNNLVFSADGQLVAAASHDFTVGLWRVDDGSPVYTFPPHDDAVLDVDLSPDGRFLASASEDATIRVYRLSDDALVHQLTGSVGGFWTVSFSPDGRYLAAGDMLGKIYLWETASGSLVRTFTGEMNKQSDLVFSPDGRLLAAGANGTDVQLWQVDNGQVVATLSGHVGVVQHLAFSPDGQSLISGGQDNALRLWQLR